MRVLRARYGVLKGKVDEVSIGMIRGSGRMWSVSPKGERKIIGSKVT